MPDAASSTPSLPEPFEELSLDELRTRTSIKWTMYEPDVLPLWVAEMDVAPVPSVVAALERAVRAGDLGYPSMGTSYADALAGVAARRWGWELDVSATQPVADVITGVVASITLLTEPGDAVLVPSPVYPPLHEFTRQMGREVVPVPLTAEGRLDLGEIEAALAHPARRSCSSAARTTPPVWSTRGRSSVSWPSSQRATASRSWSTRSTRCSSPTPRRSCRG